MWPQDSPGFADPLPYREVRGRSNMLLASNRDVPFARNRNWSTLDSRRCIYSAPEVKIHGEDRRRTGGTNIPLMRADSRLSSMFRLSQNFTFARLVWRGFMNKSLSPAAAGIIAAQFLPPDNHIRLTAALLLVCQARPRIVIR
jgi:hypothetical protein